MLYFNSLLFNNLSVVFSMTQESFSELVFGNKHKYKQRIFYADRLLVTELVQICNKLRISISHFFLVAPCSTFDRDLTKYVISVDDFQPISFNNGNIKKVYGKDSFTGSRITQNDVALKMGVSTATLYLWSVNPNQVRIDQLLKMCNLYGLSLRIFLSDANRPIAEVPEEDESYHAKELMQEIRQIKDIAAKSQKEIKHLKKSIQREYSGANPMDVMAGCLSETDELDHVKTVSELKDENDRLKDRIISLQNEIEELRTLLGKFQKMQ